MASRRLPLGSVILVDSVPAVLHGKAAVGPRRQLDVVHGTLIGDASRGRSPGPLIGDELLRHIVITGIDGVMQLPEVFQSWGRLERLEGGHGAALFRSV